MMILCSLKYFHIVVARRCSQYRQRIRPGTGPLCLGWQRYPRGQTTRCLLLANRGGASQSIPSFWWNQRSHLEAFTWRRPSRLNFFGGDVGTNLSNFWTFSNQRGLYNYIQFCLQDIYPNPGPNKHDKYTKIVEPVLGGPRWWYDDTSIFFVFVRCKISYSLQKLSYQF